MSTCEQKSSVYKADHELQEGRTSEKNFTDLRKSCKNPEAFYPAKIQEGPTPH